MKDQRVTEIYCHACSGYIHAALDYSLNGNHEITCPKCGHIHYRVIQNGEVTEDRYRSSAGMVYLATTTKYFVVSSATTTSAANIFLAQSWLNTTAGS